MGFLKFLKRDKTKEGGLAGENLDVPPVPPEIHDTPKIGSKPQKIPELPELPELDEIPKLEEHFPSINEPVKHEFKNLPSFDDLSKHEIKLPQEPLKIAEPIKIPKPMFGMGGPEEIHEDFHDKKHEIPKPEHDVSIRPDRNYFESLEREAVHDEKKVLAHKNDLSGPIYIRVDKFRRILEGINVTKNDLKISAESLQTLNEIDENRDKEFEKWRNAMVDMQKKLIFIDKTLFKR